MSAISAVSCGRESARARPGLPRQRPSAGADPRRAQRAALIQVRPDSAVQRPNRLSFRTMANRGRRCGGLCPPRSVAAIDACPPLAWNGSWDDAQNNPSAAGAVSAIARVIGAASAHGARGRTSCKRQVSDSIPLTGSHPVQSVGSSGIDRRGFCIRTHAVLLTVLAPCPRTGFRALGANSGLLREFVMGYQGGGSRACSGKPARPYGRD
jgi:hypothetical protein